MQSVFVLVYNYSSAVPSLIRRSQISQIYSVIQTSQKAGMISMNKAIGSLLDFGLISQDIALNSKINLETQAAYY